MKDVFILGAGFSKAISSGMPTLAGLIRQQIGAVIEERTALASQNEVPGWLNRLIASWHREQATIITLNYDTLVERAAKELEASAGVERILAAQMYPPYFSDVQARSGAALWGETAKLNRVEPYAWLKATLEAIAAGHPNSRIDDLLPWNFKPPSS